MNRKKIFFKNIRAIIAIVVFLVFWEAVSRLGLVSKIFISSPTDIIKQAYGLFSSGIIIPDLLLSLEIFSIGLILAIVIGFTFGIVIGFFEEAYLYLHPFVFMIGSVPKVAIVPLLILWFGIGLEAKIIIVFVMALVPILINTIDGVKNASPYMITMAQSFGANNFFIMRKIVFFEVLPYAFTGMRSAVSRAITALVVADMFGSAHGLGYLAGAYGAAFRTDRLMVVVGVLLAISLTSVGIIGIIENKLVSWNK